MQSVYMCLKHFDHSHTSPSPSKSSLFLPNPVPLFKTPLFRSGMVIHVYNPSYPKGRNWEAIAKNKKGLDV
jgi:hypothetical protein